MTTSFSKYHLLLAFKKAGLPYTYQALLRYERAGIIKRPKSPTLYGKSRSWRTYTQAEIDRAVRALKKFKGKHD